MKRPASKRHTALLLTATFLHILSSIFSPIQASQDYTYHDENKAEIQLPQKPIISIAQPHALAPKVSAHTPTVEIKSRKDGLEDVRILVFHFPQLPEATDNDQLKAIYLLDKDGLVVGYGSLSKGQDTLKIVMNSVINFVKVYIECSRHGLWMEDLSIPLK